MLKLTLLRHAKSSWNDAGASDFERTLNKRGKKDVPLMGAYMAKAGLEPDLILCSAANRTRETLSLLIDQTSFTSEIQILEELYLIGSSQLLKLLSKLDNAHKHICVIAHNPGLHELSLELSSEAPTSELRQNFPTLAMAHFELPIEDWSDLPEVKGTLKSYMTPSRLSSS